MSGELDKKAAELASDLAASAAAALKPLLRGWIHLLAAIAAVPLTVGLAVRTAHDPVRMASMLVYGLGMVQLYAVSALYHIGCWRPRPAARLRALDHANIYLMIAGTYTPVCAALLSGWVRVSALLAIWLLAATGILLSVLLLGRFRTARTGLYVALGVGPTLLLFHRLSTELPVGAVTLLALGGSLYLLGAVVYALRRPDPLPRVFGYHEVFHAFVVGASAAFAVAIWVWVAPYS